MIAYRELQSQHLSEAFRRFALCRVGQGWRPDEQLAAECHRLMTLALYDFAVVCQPAAWSLFLEKRLEPSVVRWVAERTGAQGRKEIVLRVFVSVLLDAFFDWLSQQDDANAALRACAQELGDRFASAVVRQRGADLRRA